MASEKDMQDRIQQSLLALLDHSETDSWVGIEEPRSKKYVQFGIGRLGMDVPLVDLKDAEAERAYRFFKELGEDHPHEYDAPNPMTGKICHGAAFKHDFGRDAAAAAKAAMAFFAEVYQFPGDAELSIKEHWQTPDSSPTMKPGLTWVKAKPGEAFAIIGGVRKPKPPPPPPKPTEALSPEEPDRVARIIAEYMETPQTFTDSGAMLSSCGWWKRTVGPDGQLVVQPRCDWFAQENPARYEADAACQKVMQKLLADNVRVYVYGDAAPDCLHSWKWRVTIDQDIPFIGEAQAFPVALARAAANYLRHRNFCAKADESSPQPP
jgi:hypothetical protein